MKEQIKKLLKLQRIDLQIEEALKKEKEIPKQKEKLKIQEKRLAQEIEENEKNYKRLILEQREKEKDVAQLQEQVKKLNAQLQNVKKNEEYQAMLKEIDDVKKQISLREEEVLNIMYKIDEANLFFLEQKKRIEAEIQQLREQEKRIDKELEEIVAERKELETQRAEAEKDIDAELLTQYTRIKQRRKTGPVVVPLKEEICSGCYMQITPQVVNELMAGDKIHTCRHCGRILYYPDPSIDEEFLIFAQQ